MHAHTHAHVPFSLSLQQALQERIKAARDRAINSSSARDDATNALAERRLQCVAADAEVAALAADAQKLDAQFNQRSESVARLVAK
jgi:hypothetical protein